MMPTTQNSKLKTQNFRTGFTLIELLVVIAIIMILVGLLAAGVSRAIIKGQEVRNRNDIMQLEMAVQGFKTQYGFYPPSQLFVWATQADFQNAFNAAQAALQQKPPNYNPMLLLNDSQYYLNTMFPRMTPPFAWAASTSAATLTGSQCLVFFLGGLSDPPPFSPTAPNNFNVGGVNGFGTDPRNPTNISGGRTPTFYEFQVSRLLYSIKDANGVDIPNAFPSYRDVYGLQPYLYFSAYRQPNGYSTINPNTGNPQLRYGNSDCPQVPAGPYRQVANGSFWKPNSFQIISAGRDKAFGNGVQVYTAGDISLNAAQIPPAGQDDQANFAPGVLGGGQ